MSKVTYRRSRRPGCLTIVLLLILILCGLVWLHDRFDGNLLPHSRPSIGEKRQFGHDAFPSLQETWSEGEGNTKVVRIPLTGMIVLGTEPGLFGGVSPAEFALRSIRRATLDSSVRALILEINSGGGGITASDIIHQELLRFKQTQEGRKIIVLCGDIAASGAYYVALAADKILAHPTTITGSIGVMIQTLNIRDLGQLLGIRDVTIKSGENKDLLNPFGEPTNEQVEMLQNVVDAMHERFKQLIVASRSLAPNVVSELADGRIFTAADAVQYGLIDGIGYWDDTVASLRNLLEADDLIIYRYEQAFSLRQLLRGSTSLRPSAWIEHLQGPRLMYQWRID